MIGNLITGLLDILPIGGISLTVLLSKQLAHQLIALLSCSLAKILTEHTSYQFHFRMHHLAIGLYDIGRQHQHRDKETITVTLLRLLIGEAQSLALTTIDSRIKQCAYYKS